MIKLKNISKSYSANRVLDNVSISIPEGSITGIIGPNGAGKSTLLKIISGFEFQDKGDILIFSEKIRTFSQRKKYISYMPETMSLYPEYYVKEFLDFFHRANDFIDVELQISLDLRAIFSKKIGHLSKGWHQRLKLYIALCSDKPVIVLDEPFDGFDPLQLRKIVDIFKIRNSGGRSFVLSIHQLGDAQKICDYFILLDEGEIVEEGNMDVIRSRYPTESGSLEDVFLKALER